MTILYWATTGLLSALYLTSALMYVTKKQSVRDILVGLGYPAYLWQLLIAVKLLAVAAILSRFSVALSDLAYAGVFFHLLLSAAAHLGVRKPKGAAPAVIGLLLLFASFATQNAARQPPSPYAPLSAQVQASAQD